MSLGISPQGDAGYTDRLKEKLVEQRDDLLRDSRDSDFYVFFSFDLVNSTRYKSIDRDRWPLVISRFYELVKDGITKRLAGVRLWKYIGDELLLHKRIRFSGDIYDCVPQAHDVLLTTIERLHREFPDTKPILSVKGVVWCARVHQVAPQDIAALPAEVERKPYRNIVLPPSDADLREGTDFLGPDIDVGFRIAHEARGKRLVVGADLAYLLFRDRTNIRDEQHHEWVERRLRVVDLRVLKGIWGERRYPIIWYEKDWGQVGGTFGYDEGFESPVVEKIRDKGEGALLGISLVEEVYRDLNLTGGAEELRSFLNSLRIPEKDEPTAATARGVLGSTVEVHLVALCFRPSDGHILIGRRLPTKRRLPNMWEFGCGQLRLGETWADCLRRSYKDDFAAELTFSGAAGTPLPIRTFEMEDRDERRRIPGMIFIAEVADHTAVRRSEKHSEIEWLDPTKPASWPAAVTCVPDFVETVKLAHQAWLATKNRDRVPRSA